jgi:hypothetical protein
MWSHSRFEERLRRALTAELGDDKGSVVYGAYLSARKVLLEDILLEIRGTEPYLTDHGPDHIHNVLENADALLPADGNHFDARELYVLALGALFHDVGNVEGRKSHNQRVSKYYDHARPGSPERWAQEKRLVVSASQAHTGLARDGTFDTLKDVPEINHLDGAPIRLRQIAALIRFADELAEGRQRTSLFLKALGKYPATAKIHHDYASVTNVAIDRGNRRIALTYHLIFESCGTLDDDRLKTVNELLGYIYGRITKLDDERKYARYYCPDLLLPFRETSVHLDIQLKGEFQDLGLDQVCLSDIVIPGGKSMTLPEINSAYEPDRIGEKLKDLLNDPKGKPVDAADPPARGNS